MEKEHANSLFLDGPLKGKFERMAEGLTEYFHPHFASIPIDLEPDRHAPPEIEKTVYLLAFTIQGDSEQGMGAIRCWLTMDAWRIVDRFRPKRFEWREEAIKMIWGSSPKRSKQPSIAGPPEVFEVRVRISKLELALWALLGLALALIMVARILRG